MFPSPRERGANDIAGLLDRSGVVLGSRNRLGRLPSDDSPTGDAIATGTPPGIGVHRDPPELLEVSDTARVEIEEIDGLENSIVLEEQ